ncbi:hypothetical protein [Nocardia cyriacigeorgica]|uniref:hypothetical protein n=1 Tax=Nocardia cyriacigeorgica TaxID=135487 RepID=UPI0024564F3F|nr:hypothetical protein [Nocardia cyriacigeorgica]
MIRTSAAIAASACALALFVAGCEDETSSSVAQTTAATSGSASASATGTKSGTATSDAAAPSTEADDDMGLDTVKVSSFVVAYKQAFPSLSDGRSDEEIGEIFTDTCEDIHEGKPESEILTEISNRTKNGRGSASPEESKAIYEMIKVLC